MKRLIVLTIVMLTFLVCFCACSMPSPTNVASQSTSIPTATNHLVKRWDPEKFEKMRNMNLKQIDSFVELLATVIEQGDAESLRFLFAPGLLENDLSDSDVKNLFAFFEGEVTTVKRLACYDSEQREGSQHYVETMIACSIETSVRTFHIAVKLRIVDSKDVNNVGIHSLYITDDECWNTQFVYWGGHEWCPGVIIDTNPTLFSTEATG